MGKTVSVVQEHVCDQLHRVEGRRLDIVQSEPASDIEALEVVASHTTMLMISRCRVTGGIEFIKFLVLITFVSDYKDSARRVERKELARFSFPSHSLSYPKIVQGEWKEKSLLDFLSRFSICPL